MKKLMLVLSLLAPLTTFAGGPPVASEVYRSGLTFNQLLNRFANAANGAPALSSFALEDRFYNCDFLTMNNVLGNASFEWLDSDAKTTHVAASAQYMGLTSNDQTIEDSQRATEYEYQKNYQSVINGELVMPTQTTMISAWTYTAGRSGPREDYRSLVFKFKKLDSERIIFAGSEQVSTTTSTIRLVGMCWTQE